MEKFFRSFLSAWRGSTLQVIAAVVLPLTFLLVAISFGSYFIHLNAMRSMVGERDERAARAAASAIEAEIGHRAGSIRGLALLAGDGSAQNLERALADSGYLLGDFDLGLAFSAPDGSILASSGQAELWKQLPAPIQAGRISTLTVAGRPVVLVSSAVPGSKQLALGAFSASSLLAGVLAKDFPAGGMAAVYVFDASYQVLFKSGPGTLEGDPAQHPGIREALAGGSGATYMQTTSDEHVLAYSHVAPVGWGMVIEEPWEAVANPTLQTSQITPMILIPALLLAALALWFGAEQIVRPLRALETRAARLAWGDFKEIEQPVGGIAEIRHLQSELAHMAAQLQAAQQRLHTYIGAITQGQEDERQRLARELHDDTIQALIALKQRAQLLRRAPGGEASLPALSELETLTSQTIDNLRRTIRALRPIYLEDLGLAAALEMLANETGQNSTLKIDFQASGQERRLAPETELALYRMVQEALNNIVRHANASQGLLKVAFSPEALDLQVIDNGVGFDLPKSPTEFSSDGHFGLVGLYERAGLIGAGLKISSTPGGGTQLDIHLPAGQIVKE
ncbi:MAG TPA: sensor histidine kinase [Anaerolineales bacterium]